MNIKNPVNSIKSHPGLTMSPCPSNLRTLSAALSFLILFTLTIFPANSLLAAPAEPFIPPTLSEWAKWIVARNPEWDCAASNDGGRVCDWATRLDYVLGQESATFNLSGEMLAAGEIPLPRSTISIPHNLKIKPAGHVVIRGENLVAQLPAGKFIISGQVRYSPSEPRLPAPDNVGIISVEPLGDGLSVTRREGAMRVEKVDGVSDLDSQTITVYRRLIDGSPMELITEIRLSLSGHSRMIALGRAIPIGSLPIELQSQLPAQITSEGSLTLQAKQGEHIIRIRSILKPTTKEIELRGEKGSGWPEIETFTFAANPSLRAVRLDGGQALHADSAPLDPEWRNDAVYTVPSDGTITINEISRGEQNIPSPKLKLQRELWWSFDGSRITHQDQLSGTVGRASRLNLSVGNHLGRATIGGEPVLITEGPDNKASPKGDSQTQKRGIEIRVADVDLTGVGWQSSKEPLLTHGWDTTMSSVEGVLHLPPAWKLITILGAGYVSGAWVDSWSLLDIFITILVILGARVVLDKKAAVALGVMLVITHGEFLAPQMLFVHLLILLGWRKVLTNKESNTFTVVNGLLLVTALVWGLQALTFEKLQITEFLFPQLQAGTRYRTGIQALASALNSNFFVWPMIIFIPAILYFITSLPKEPTRASYRHGVALFCLAVFVFMFIARSMVTTSYNGTTSGHSIDQSGSVSSYSASRKGYSGRSYSNASEVAESPSPLKNILEEKKLAAGPALPTWNWRRHIFKISGPIAADDTLTIIALSPGWCRFLSALRLIVVGLVGLLMIKRLKQVITFTFALLFLMGTNSAFAQIVEPAELAKTAKHPTQSILTQLTAQLSGTLCNGPECVTIKQMQISTSDRDNELVVSIEVSSRGRSSVSLPGPISEFLPKLVSLDGTPAAVRRNSDDFVAVLIPDGEHKIEASFALPRENSATITLPEPLPLFTTTDSSEWSISGISETGIAQKTIELNRLREGEKVSTSINPSLLANWFVADRKITLSNQFSVSTTVHRLGDISKPASVELELLADERIVKGAVEVNATTAKILFSPGQREVSYGSIIPSRSNLSLRATSAPQLSEEWMVSCSPLLNCKLSGLPYQMKDQIVFKPLPGETLSVEIKDLAAISGEALSLDQVSHGVNWSTSLISGTVKASARVTQQEDLLVKLPASGVVDSITVDNIVAGGRVEDGEIRIPLTPGNHQIDISYNLQNSGGSRFSIPEFTLSAPSNNITITATPPLERWILWTGGGLFGPSVVYWGKLLGVIAICLILKFTKLVELSTVSAILLGLGLTSLPMIRLWIPLVWLGALKRLHDSGDSIRDGFSSKRGFKITTIALTIISLCMLYEIVQIGLVLNPPMLIAGANSTARELRWIFDLSDGRLPTPYVLSLPIEAWRFLSLIWASWLVTKVLGWIREVFVGR